MPNCCCLDDRVLKLYNSDQHLQVISDTGTSFIGAPKPIADAIAAQAGAVYNDEYGAYLLECNARIPDLVLRIGRHRYPIRGSQMIIGEGSLCELAIFAYESGDDSDAVRLILGDPFIRSFCQVASLCFGSQLRFSKFLDLRYRKSTHRLCTSDYVNLGSCALVYAKFRLV